MITIKVISSYERKDPQLPLRFEELQHVWVSVEVFGNGISHLIVVHLQGELQCEARISMVLSVTECYFSPVEQLPVFMKIRISPRFNMSIVKNFVLLSWKNKRAESK